MEVSRVECSDELYVFWKEVSHERPYAAKRDRDEFSHHFFENPSVQNRCYLVEDEGKELGAVMLGSYKWATYLHDWVERKKEDVFRKLLQKIKDRVSNEPIILAPMYVKGYEDWEKVGFERDERAPFIVLMRKELEGEKGVDLRVKEVNERGQTKEIEQLASLLTDISGRWESKDRMMENIRWELEEGWSYFLASDEKPIGYCGYERRELFSGKDMYWIRETGVCPERRREGIATDLLLYTLKKIEMDGGEEAYIDTHSKNPAMKLYKELGFRVVEKVPNLIYEVS